MSNSKKLANLIALVVFLATNIFSSLSYATAGEEDNIDALSQTESEETFTFDDVEKSTEQEDGEILMDSSSKISHIDNSVEALEGQGDSKEEDVYTIDGQAVIDIFALDIQEPGQLEILSNTYTLTFNANGGTLTDEATQSVEENHTATKPTDPVKPSYTFVGWYENSSFLGEPFDFSKEITGDLILYAKYVCDAGYLEIDNECVKDTTVPVCERGEPSITPIKAGGTGTITLTCVDAGVGLNSNIISVSDIVMSGNGLVTLTGGFVLYEGGITATLVTNEDGSKTVTYEGKSYTLAGSDVGIYQWGYPGDYNDDNVWGGGGDNETNGYNSGFNPDRQGPCSSGWHVPSAGEWNDLIVAWCHSSQECTNYATYSDWGEKVYFLDDAFRNDFNMSQDYYWSSSPMNMNGAYDLDVSDTYVYPGYGLSRDYGVAVRCLKNSESISEPQKTYTFIYTAKDKVNGNVNFILPENIVKDSEGNSALSTISNTPVVVDNTALYNVEYYIEKLDGTYEVQQTGTEVGTIATQVTAIPKELEGFTFSGTNENNLLTGIVLDDGTLVLKLYYTRNSYDVEYQFSNEPAGHSLLPISQKYKYGESVTVESDATAPGYTFAWNTGNFIMPANNVMITGVFTPIQYVVSFDANLSGVDNPVDMLVTYDSVYGELEMLSKSGYIFNGWKDGQDFVTSGTVYKTVGNKILVGDWTPREDIVYIVTYKDKYGSGLLDNKTVITGIMDSEVIENAPEISGYTVQTGTFNIRLKSTDNYINFVYNPNEYVIKFVDGSGTRVEIYSGEYLSGTLLLGYPDWTKDGYTIHWDKNIPVQTPLNGIVITANWIPNLDTQYLVYHQKEKLDGTYETVSVYTGHGITDSKVTPAVNVYTGFNSPEVEEIIIAGDGSTILTYQYSRKIITLTLNNDNGSPNTIITGKYGANVDKSAINPVKTGYVFATWSPLIPDKFLVTSGTYTAQYSLDTYTITYNLNGGINHLYNPEFYTYLSGDVTLKEPTRNGYIFVGWRGTGIVGIKKTVVIPTYSIGNRTYTAIRVEDKNENNMNDMIEQHFTVKFLSGEGLLSGRLEYDNILVGLTLKEAEVIIPGILMISGYVFKGWMPKTPELSDVVGDDVTYTAIWKKDVNNNGIADEEEIIPTPSGGSSGGGGGGGGSKKKSMTDDHGFVIDKNVEVSSKKDLQEDNKGEENLHLNLDDDLGGNDVGTGTGQILGLISSRQTSGSLKGSYTQEQLEAYAFAKINGITTKSSIDQAQMGGKLTRIAMAKMLSQYAINILGRQPDTSRIIKFDDVTDKRDSDYDNGVTFAYQLGIMGINMQNNKFRPDDIVTRGEFVTAFSRMLYNTSDGEYKSTPKYYIHHMEKLVKEGIVTKDDPNMKELRGYVMIMLMRSVEVK